MANINLATIDKTPKLVAPQGDFHEAVKKRLEDIRKLNQHLHPLFFRVYANTAPPSQAIKAKCLDCCWQRDEITHCNAVTCPLHNLRPYQEAKTKQ